MSGSNPQNSSPVECGRECVCVWSDVCVGMECGVSECGRGVCVCVELVNVGVGVECVE